MAQLLDKPFDFENNRAQAIRAGCDNATRIFACGEIGIALDRNYFSVNISPCPGAETFRHFKTIYNKSISSFKPIARRISFFFLGKQIFINQVLLIEFFQDGNLYFGCGFSFFHSEI